MPSFFNGGGMWFISTFDVPTIYISMRDAVLEKRYPKVALVDNSLPHCIMGRYR